MLLLGLLLLVRRLGRDLGLLLRHGLTLRSLLIFSFPIVLPRFLRLAELVYLLAHVRMLLLYARLHIQRVGGNFLSKFLLFFYLALDLPPVLRMLCLLDQHIEIAIAIFLDFRVVFWRSGSWAVGREVNRECLDMLVYGTVDWWGCSSWSRLISGLLLGRL